MCSYQSSQDPCLSSEQHGVTSTVKIILDEPEVESGVEYDFRSTIMMMSAHTLSIYWLSESLLQTFHLKKYILKIPDLIT